ncbi:MAG: alkaline phosphatase family protein [Sedimentibacter sp.]|uniref:alkaline phosphatase family protein n=1 Tax=Sedimentibacter sp. TaxID=1960295 RepID=UPI003159783B
MDTKKYAVSKILMVAGAALLMWGCAVKAANEEEYKGVYVFDMHQDIASNYQDTGELSKIEGVAARGYSKAAVILENGHTVIAYADIIMKGDGVAVVEDKEISGVKGIYLHDDFCSITDAYKDAKEFLDEGEKVLVVLLDGLSLRQYEAFCKENSGSFIKSCYKTQALSVFTPVTNAGYAAIITGQWPDVNGVYDRSFRDLKVESIFGYSLKNNKNTILLEGDVKILNTESEPVLHTDLDNDGDTDDEMYDSALKACGEDYDLIFLHFHGIDDRGHSYGPMDEETLDYIETVDGYLKSLSDEWNGKIIMTADHGMHETEDGGGHGLCCYYDMVVPYFVRE